MAFLLACALLANYWPQKLAAHYWSQRNVSPLLQSVQLCPDLKGFGGSFHTQHASTQARTVYYPFQAVGLSDDVGVTLLGLSARFVSSEGKPVQVFAPGGVRFQLPAAGLGRFADAGGPVQFVPFAFGNPDEFERLKSSDGTLSGTLFLEGFRASMVRLLVNSPRDRQDFAIAGRKCTVESFLHENKLNVTFDCVELEPGNTSGFDVRLPQDNPGSTSTACSGNLSGVGLWPPFLTPIAMTHFTCELSRDTAPGSAGESTPGREVLVIADQSLGRVTGDFHIEHFRPVEFDQRAWKQRVIAQAESSASQPNFATVPDSR